MAIKRYRPLNPARRIRTRVDKIEITKNKPEKSLTMPKKKTGGRNSHGRITIRHRGGGSKQKLRIIDFKRLRAGKAEVISVEYDPNRSANIALIKYEDGKKAYILHPKGLKVGDIVESGPDAELTVGNTRKLKNLPDGTVVHNVELKPGGGGILVRSAGANAVLMAKEGNHAQLKMPSGEVRLVNKNCMGTIGTMGNSDHYKIKLGSAGSTRHRGRRPKVRGTAMNAVDHPHGGGRGKSKGNNLPSTPWGKKCKGVKTRNKNKPSEKLILRRKKKRKK
ncbi:MAG: 50S ribosomal protein L2 [Elusimicrobia bacterium]|jgi:large subunit ribosomal protein L2|nr:50S ribosomal protein L2 [Elusimicrobiota bacterium]